MSAAKQPSTDTVVIGFPTGETITGFRRTGYDKGSEATIEDVMDENNDIAAQVISNKITTISVNATLQSTATIPVVGDVVTINSVKYLVHSITVSYTPTIARISMQLRKPANVTYT